MFKNYKSKIISYNTAEKILKNLKRKQQYFVMVFLI